ncbi:MAG: 3'-5' exonuclease [Phycisphaerae bacterium]|nr:3'-5' exonuclease [Phycisphaerae bacterium]
MEWVIILVLVVAGIYLFFRFKKRKANFSMLPKQFIVLDLETTGLDPTQHEIIEIGAVKVNRDSDNHTSLHALIKPSKKIPNEITQITGISQEMVERDGENLESVIKEFMEFFGDLRLVAYNAKFDMSFLKTAAKNYGLTINNPSSCALKMARRAWPGLKSYKLGDLAKTGGLSTKGAHRALKDCELTMIVYTSAASELGTPQ